MAQWDRCEWNADRVADAARRAIEPVSGRYGFDPCPVVPEWVRALVDDRAYPPEAPCPTLCTLWLEDADWFRLADQHPDELTVSVDCPLKGPEFTVDQVRAAWALVRSAGGVPFIGGDLCPEGPFDQARVGLGIQAFYAAVPAGREAVVGEVAALLGCGPRQPDRTGAVRDGELAVRARGLGLTVGSVAGWDWLFSDLPRHTEPTTTA